MNTNGLGRAIIAAAGFMIAVFLLPWIIGWHALDSFMRRENDVHDS